MEHTHTTFVSTSVSSSSHLMIISLYVDFTNDGLLDVFQFTLLRRHGVYLVLGCINCKLTRISVEMSWYMYLGLLFSNVDFYNDTIDYPTLALCFVTEIDKFSFIKLVYIRT